MTTARFATSPIGPGLLALNSGLTLTTGVDGADLSCAARSDIGHASGSHGAEFSFWGEADLQAVIGIVQPSSSLAAMVGAGADSVGWRLDTGQIYSGNAVLASGLPSVVLGEIVGVHVDLSTNRVAFFKGATQVHSRAIDAGATWHFAISLAAAEAATLWAATNAGQWQGVSAAAQTGWRAHAPVVPATRISDIDWLSPPADTPANTRYDGLIDTAGVATVAALGCWWWGGDMPQQGGAAQLTVLDAGQLDALALDDVAGAPVSIRIADRAGTIAASAGVARFVVDRIETLDDGRKTVGLRDAHDDLDEPINPGVFLPNIPALAWRVQPAVIGAVASVPALPANSDGSACWLSDSALHVAAVMDRGDPMEPGTWSMDPSQQQLLLEQPPVGPMVADASSIGVAMQPATLDQFLRDVMGRIRKSAWSSADAAAIDAATGYAGVGYYAGDIITARQAMAAVLPSYGAWWYQDGEGVLRIARVVDPASRPGTFTIAGVDLDEDLVVMPDEAPNLSRRMAYRPNARVLAAGELVTDLVDVPVMRRGELTAPWRGQVYSAQPMAARYQHAATNPPIVSTFWRPEDAQAEIDRVCGLYAQARAFYVATFTNHAFTPAPGAVGELTYPRYGLQAGKRVLIRSIERNPMTGKVTLTMWG